MRKIILSVFVIAMIIVLGVGLTACNNATAQGQLANILKDHNHEVFVYDAYNTKDGTSGTLTVKLDAYKSGPVELGSRTIEKANKGIRILSELVFGDTTYHMGCYFVLVNGMSYMTPAYTFRTIEINGATTFDMQGKYNNGSFECERYQGENTIKNSAKLSGTVFDNNQFQQVLRSVTTFSSGLNLSFTTPIISDNGISNAKLSAVGTSSTVKVKTQYSKDIEEYAEEGFPCYQINISRATDVAGMAQTLYYAQKDLKCNGWGMKNVLVKIIEPFTDNGKGYEMQYTLNSVSLS